MGPVDFSLQVFKYEAEKPREKSLIILPPTGKTNIIDRSYAKMFAKHGYDVYILDSWNGIDEEATDLDLHQRLYTRAQKAIEVALENIHTPYIGVLGTSVGAMHASVAASRLDRINAVFCIVGGVPMTEIIAKSEMKAMRDLKEKRQKIYGFKNDEEYLTELNKHFHLEPLKLEQKFKNKRLGLVISTQDTTVPTNTQVRLKEFWKPEKVIELPNNHFWAIVNTWLHHKKKVLEFFEKPS